ncbi:MAG: hypothetical protein WA715_15705, partial [Candidatus Acidiferrum sp.]
MATRSFALRIRFCLQAMCVARARNSQVCRSSQESIPTFDTQSHPVQTQDFDFSTAEKATEIGSPSLLARGDASDGLE